MVCSFCRSSAGYLAEGPGVSICEACITEALSRAVDTHVEDKCSFCNKDRNMVLVNAANDVGICSECIQIARRVVEHERATQ